MKTTIPRLACHLAVVVAALLSAPLTRGQTVTQALPLVPGWNAVWLEVQPAEGAPAQVFAGLPVSSVWQRTERLEAAQFIQDQNEVPFNEPGWLLWLAPAQPDAAILTSLFAIQANRAYLVKLEGNTGTTWTVTGELAARPIRWAPDAFNLVGFPADPDGPPTFGDFFAAAPAHFDRSTQRRRPMYRLGADGQWALLEDTDTLRRGEACWIYAQGASSFGGPLEAASEFADGLEFGPVLNQRRLRVRNLASAGRTIELRVVGAEVGVLAWQQWSATEGYIWPDLPAQFELPLGAGGTDTLTLAVRRAAMAGPLRALLEVRDGAGMLIRLPISADRSAPSQAAARAGRGLAAPSEAPPPFGGLWVGNALVTAVAEVNRDATQVTTTKNPFPLRLLVHVDAEGTARLLKEVIQLWEDGTYRTLPDGTRVADQPGRYVLVTDNNLLGSFAGAGVRDGVPVGKRISSAGFEFDDAPSNALLMDGVFGPGGKLTATLRQSGDAPTNPFKHKYHPDHDNLDVRFEPIPSEAQAEVFTVQRDFEFEFTATDPAGGDEPAFGHDRVAGLYRETLSGLHRQPIRVAGTFSLRRLTDVTDLNPQPMNLP